MNTVTCIAPVNIAVIKYWGKRDESLILPTNDSISATLDTDQLHAKTTVMINLDFKKDRIWLNEREEDIKNPRLQNCLKEIKKRSQLPGYMNDWKIHICSKNNFPTAAGLASSAAGYACLAAALAKLYKVEGDISVIARSGSGSACRSIMGGFVRWHMGLDKCGTDSLAKQIVPASHWPEMRILVTFDAGPNVTLYLLEKDVPTVMGVLNHFFPPLENVAVEYKRGLSVEEIKPTKDLLEKLKFQKQPPGQFKYIIYTKVGDGPKYLNNPEDHLLDGQGNPINIS